MDYSVRFFRKSKDVMEKADDWVMTVEKRVTELEEALKAIKAKVGEDRSKASREIKSLKVKTNVAKQKILRSKLEPRLIWLIHFRPPSPSGRSLW